MSKADKECTHIISIYQEKQENKGNLYLSGLNVFRDPHFKQKLGVNCVVTVIDKGTFYGCKVSQKVKQRGIQHHKWFQIDDIPQETILPFFQQAHLYIGQKLKQHNVLVHCMIGKSRSSSIVMAFLMKEFAMSFQEARDFVRQKRDIVKPNPGFVKDLYRYQTILNQNRKIREKEEQEQKEQKEQIKEEEEEKKKKKQI